MKHLWLVALFVLIPISTMRADEKKIFILNIPSEINTEYIVKYNLVPLDYIDLGDGTGIVPFVTAKEKSFMEAEGCVSENFNVEMELIFLRQ